MVGKIIKHVWFRLKEGLSMDEGERKELLISKWFPITEVSVESIRERSASSALPPLYFLHVWFARRPLAACRAAVLGSLLPPSVTRKDFLELLGIPIDVDLQKAQERLARAKSSGVQLKENPFFWKRAYEHIPTDKELHRFHESLKSFWGSAQPLVVDPMAGGGSIQITAKSLTQTLTITDALRQNILRINITSLPNQISPMLSNKLLQPRPSSDNSLHSLNSRFNTNIM
jgi:hypothetical protein